MRPKDDDPMHESIATELLAYDLGEPDPPDRDPWWRVARGELSVDQLVTERADLDGADEDELRRLALLYAPPSEQELERARDELIERYFSEGAGEDDGEGGEGSGQATDSDATEVTGAVVDLDGRRRRRSWWVGGGLLAAAAAVALVWVTRPPRGPTGEPMPGFEAVWSNQYAGSMRGADDDPSALGAAQGCDASDPIYHLDGTLTVRLRPETSTPGEVVVAASAVRSDEKPRWLSLTPELGMNGVVIIDDNVSTMGLEPGRWTITFLVAREDQLPASGALDDESLGSVPGAASIRSTICVVQ